MVSCLLLFVLVVFLVFTWGLLGAILGPQKSVGRLSSFARFALNVWNVSAGFEVFIKSAFYGLRHL